MKKLLLISEPGSGGVKKNVVDIIKNINHKEFQVYLIYSNIRADEDYLATLRFLEKESLVKIYEVNDLQRNISLKKDFTAFIKIFNIIRKVQPDIVHCHSSKAGVLGRLASRIIDVKKIVYTPHAYIFQSPEINRLRKIFYIILEKFLTCVCTNYVINVSYEERKFALDNKIGKSEKFYVIHNGIENFSNAGTHSKENQIICVARMEAQKNPFEVLKIAESLRDKGITVPIFFIGDGTYYKSVVKYAENKKLSNIYFLGYQPEVRKFLIKSKLFLSTSKYEGFPYVLLEALSCGTPILSSDVIGNRELTVNGITGWRYPLGNVDEAARIIIDVIKGEKSIGPDYLVEYVNRNFSIRQMIEKLEHIYLKK